MSDQIKALLQLANTPALRGVLLPCVDEARQSVMWESVLYDDRSHSQKIALSWAYVIWRDEKPPEDWLDPFHEFHEVNIETREAILRAFATRHGFTHFEIDTNEPPELPGGSEEARQHALERLADANSLYGLFDAETSPEKWNVRGLSGGERTAASWAYAIRLAKLPPNGWRDPFEGFSILDVQVQAYILRVFAEANGFYEFEPKRALTAMEKFAKRM
jgi:hypothetical protein